MTRQETEHHTTTGTHQPRGLTRWFARRRRRTSLHQTRGRLDPNSHQPRGSATSCPPSRSTGHHRRLLCSARSIERHPHSSRDHGAHAYPLDLEYDAVRAPGALDDANQTIHRREARRCRFDDDIEQAKTTAREAFLVVKRTR